LLNVVDEPDGTFPSDRQGYDGMRKNYGIPYRKNGQFGWNRLDTFLNLIYVFKVTFHWF
jgi:hypothetical protein